MDDIESIKSNEIVVMNKTLQRLFRIAGCDPACHCCSRKLNIGANFKLAEVENNDEK
jgi:hypothetical protein